MQFPTQRLRIHTEAFGLRAGLTGSVPQATSICSDFPLSYSASVSGAQRSMTSLSKENSLRPSKPAARALGPTTKSILGSRRLSPSATPKSRAGTRCCALAVQASIRLRHCPLHYRPSSRCCQEQINARSGVHTPRSTLAAWGGQTGAPTDAAV